MTGVFVTSVGTGIGKTLITAGLAAQLEAQGRAVEVLKPVVTGFDPNDFQETDPAVLLSALGRDPTLAAVEGIAPFRFEAPLAPSMASEAEGRSLDFDALVAFCRSRMKKDVIALIEGVGGLMVPLTRQKTVLDWMTALDLPAILVTGTYLGAISHTLTALEVLRARKTPLKGVVVSESLGGVDLAGTVDALADFTTSAIVSVPRVFGTNPWQKLPDLTCLFK